MATPDTQYYLVAVDATSAYAAEVDGDEAVLVTALRTGALEEINDHGDAATAASAALAKALAP